MTLYFEVSARRTGKTTRLCSDILKHISPLNRIAIFTPSIHHGYSVKKMLEDMSSSTWLSSIEYNPDPTELDPNFNWKYYFDDFDFIQPKRVFLRDDGYYVTTPAKLRSWDEILKQEDLFSILMMKTYHQYHRYPLSIQDVERLLKYEVPMSELGVYLRNENSV